MFCVLTGCSTGRVLRTGDTLILLHCRILHSLDTEHLIIRNLEWLQRLSTRYIHAEYLKFNISLSMLHTPMARNLFSTNQENVNFS